VIHFHQDELDGLVDTLRNQPGFITVAVVPAGSGDALLERLHERLGDLEIEVAPRHERPVTLGTRATRLGQDRDGYVFVLRLDEPEIFASEDETVRFWHSLNYQREALASGTVRTCFILNEESQRGMAQLADDLWDWTTTFHFPEATRASVRTPADSAARVWPDDDQHPRTSGGLKLLRSQRQRARRAGLPQATFVENYVVPLFLALPESHDTEAIELWECDLRSSEAVERLPPETSLSVARKIMHLARLGEAESPRNDLVQGALTVAERAIAILERKASTHPEAFELGLAAALSTLAKFHQDVGRFEVALREVERCLDLLRRLAAMEEAAEALVKAHLQRRWALWFLLQARESYKLPLFEQIDRLRTVKDSGLDDDLRSKALGTALEISITQSENRAANAGLFTTWLLSHDSQLVGPRFEQVLVQDPVSYCKSVKALWQLTPDSPWDQLLVEPLNREWPTNGPVRASIREQLAGVPWLS
jgi:hypothetical protein